MSGPSAADRALAILDEVADEMIAFAADLVRIPTVNPPGEAYPECAALIADRMRHLGFEVETFEPTSCPAHTPEHPRVNVVGSLGDPGARPCIHFNGHYDVVPPGEGWTVDPFGGLIRDGRLYGRGSADMKAGLAAALYAAHALDRADALGGGRVEVSATVDEESGGFGGVAHLCKIGRISAERTDYVIIPEPFGVDGISIGHRGVYWCKVVAHGRTAHGSMPHLGRSAIDALARVIELIRTELAPRLAERRTAMPVVPEAARHPTINVNSISGGQPPGPSDRPHQTPCVADRAEAVLDRRFIAEETIAEVREEIRGVLDHARAEDPERRYELTDLMVVEPVLTSAEAPLVRALRRAIEDVAARPARLVASPGTYDQKHVVRLGGVEQCVAYGPGELGQAHQPDESCSVAEIVDSARILALTSAELRDLSGAD